MKDRTRVRRTFHAILLRQNQVGLNHSRHTYHYLMTSHIKIQPMSFHPRPERVSTKFPLASFFHYVEKLWSRSSRRIRTSSRGQRLAVSAAACLFRLVSPAAAIAAKKLCIRRTYDADGRPRLYRLPRPSLLSLISLRTYCTSKRSPSSQSCHWS